MRFGEFAIDDALGAILAHRVDGALQSYKKGHRLSSDDIENLRRAGVSKVLGAIVEDEDASENEAAFSLGKLLAGAGLRVADAFTGRCNLFATADGVFTFNTEAILAVNRLDERVTIATLPAFDAVRVGQMVATIKIIPFSVPNSVLSAALKKAERAKLAVSAFRAKSAALIQTKLDGTAEKVLDKTVRVTRDRLAAVGIDKFAESRCRHNKSALQADIGAIMRDQPDILLIAGASAITDRRDILPQAIVDAGGKIEYFGMPVDPGNLLLVARLGATPVLGMPGCARSPKLNGFDWVLQRLAAGVPVSASDIQAMGVGGLLGEIPTRPQPRHRVDRAPAKPRIAGLLLAAGQSRRMGKRNKLLIEVSGKPLVQHAADALISAGLEPIIVVSGYQAETLVHALEGQRLRIVHNPDYTSGLASSLKRGIEALPDGIDGAVVALGDMPLVDRGLIQRLVEAFDTKQNRSIIVPTVLGKRGNPVLWAERYFEAMMALEGDVGAKHLIGLFEESVFEVDFPDSASLLDLDTPEALEAFETMQ